MTDQEGTGQQPGERSPYGQPAPEGQPLAEGQPAVQQPGYPPQGYPQGYPQQGYPQQGYPQGYAGYPPPPFGPPPLPPGVAYASWGARFAAYLVDVLALFGCMIPGIIAVAALTAPLEPGEDPGGLAIATFVILLVGGLFVWIWQFSWRAGARGQSWGKQLVGIHLVREHDIQPPGGLTGLGRYALRWALGNVSCGAYTVITFLWPLWDDRKQTLDDKMLHTLVVRLPTKPV